MLFNYIVAQNLCLSTVFKMVIVQDYQQRLSICAMRLKIIHQRHNPNRILYYHDPEDDFSNVELFSILGVIIGVWWGIVHFFDWITFDAIPWWGEPLTLFIAVPIFIVCLEYGKNPLLWWPLCFGTKVLLDPYEDIEPHRLLKKYGGKWNVYVGWDVNMTPYIKFRKKRDAVFYSLKNSVF